MTTRLSFLEARVAAGNFILGLMGLLLGYEYITARYLSRIPDYRLSYIIGAATIGYFLVLRFVTYERTRQMPILSSAATSVLDLLAALGVVGLILEFGNYPVAFLLNVEPALYAFAPPGSVSVLIMSAAFAVFILPRVGTHFILPPTPVMKVAPQAAVKIGASSLEDLIAALEKSANLIGTEAETENPVVDPRNARLLVRLGKVMEGLRSTWSGLDNLGISVPEMEELPPMVNVPPAIGGVPRSRWSNLTVIGQEPASPVERESLTEVLTANPWAKVLASRALRRPDRKPYS